MPSVQRVDKVFFAVNGTEANEREEMGFEKKFKLNSEGFLAGKAPVTNVGVFTYVQEDGSLIRELRSPEEVFDESSLESLRLKPLTNDHPNEAVNPENIKNLQVGSLGDSIDYDSFRVFAPITITESQAIQDTKDGKRALSCGYKTDLIFESGVWMGVAYDAKQTNIRYNHIAIVDQGRAGDDAIMRMDSKQSIGKIINHKTKEDKMPLKKITLDGVPREAEAEVLTALNDANKRADSVQAEKDSLQGKLDASQEENQALKKKLDSSIDSEKLDSLVANRIALLKVCEEAGVKVKADSSDSDLKKAVILSVSPKADLTEKSEAYIDGRFDTSVESIVALKNHDGSNIADNQNQENNDEIRS